MKHTVQPGETLKTIAKKYMGSENGSTAIWALNADYIAQEQRRLSRKHRGPEWVYPGMVIEIPLDPSKG